MNRVFMRPGEFRRFCGAMTAGMLAFAAIGAAQAEQEFPVGWWTGDALLESGARLNASVEFAPDYRKIPTLLRLGDPRNCSVRLVYQSSEGAVERFSVSPANGGKYCDSLAATPASIRRDAESCGSVLSIGHPAKPLLNIRMTRQF